MQTFTKHAMPMYTQDQHAFVRQMYEWHMKMVQYHDQLRAHHLERVGYFRKHIEESAKTLEIPSENSAA
jgi:hypothetical protein